MHTRWTWQSLVTGLLSLYALAALPSVGIAQASEASGALWKVGAAKRSITPDPLLPVSGGLGPTHPVSGKKGELTVRAAVFRRGTTTVGVVSLDVLGFPSVLGDRVRKLVPRIPPDHILIGATHTHSAPCCYAFPDGKGGHTGDLKYIDWVCHQAAEALNEAFDRAMPARIRIGTDEAQGKIAFNYYAPPLYDRRMSVIEAVTPKGETIVTLVNYAIHPEVLGPDAGLVSPDCIGPMVEKLEATRGGMAMFMNGAQGGMITADNRDFNAKPDPYRAKWPSIGTWEECVRIGHQMASEAARIADAADWQKRPILACHSRDVTFPVESDAIWAVVKHSPLNYPRNEEDRTVTSRINLVQLGDAQILTIPGEALPNIGFYLKRKMRGRHNLLFGLTNDAFGYILTKVDYKSFPIYDYVSRTSLGEYTGEILIEASLKLIESASGTTTSSHSADRPNILLCIADDWGYPHAGCYGDQVVRTPHIDALAKRGVRFEHAFVSSPSCTPSRGALLTGQWHWRLGAAGNLWCIWPGQFKTYVDLLEAHGYAVGFQGKGWGPGRAEGRNPAGPRFRSFQEFLEKKDPDKPFCFWIGTIDPHRPYKPGSGRASGLDLDRIRLPGCFPDSPVVRSDVADYYFEVERFDRVVGHAVETLRKRGELEKTLIVVTGDHGMPFPRGKSNLYDLGTRVPLIVHWPQKIDRPQVVSDFVSLCDLAPTFLHVAGVARPAEMTGRSLLPILTSGKSGQVDPSWSWIIFGKERHVPAQEAPDMGGYPCRAIRTRDFLYIRNYRPDRWPNGTPHYQRAAIRGVWYGDTDNGPTKSYIIDHRNDDPHHLWYYRLCFAKRPREELYDLRRDPEQLHNVAGDPAYAADLKSLSQRLTRELIVTGDPREVGGAEETFEKTPYLGRGPRYPH